MRNNVWWLVAAAAMMSIGCSAPDKSSGKDPVVVTTCGNGVLDGDEVCDGDNLSGSTCEDLGASAGELSCKSDCSGFTVAECGAPATCGNGELDEVEVCDGVATATCTELGFEGGEISCLANCLDHDTSACGPPVTCEGADCECVPQCGNRECGVDPVCGEPCGTCEDGMCNEIGMCELTPRARFESGAMEWSVPEGGEHLAGFDALGGTPGGSDYDAVGADAWSTVDLTGDGLPDLVLTATAVERDGYYHWSRVRGYDSNPHWLVYVNEGTRFADTAIDWPVPDGGEYLAGFDALSGTPGGSDYDAVGSDAWTTTDLTGDGLPDLVVTATAVVRDGYYHWSRVRGFGTDPHWAVYENTGTGFATTATTWAVPDGGEYLAGFDALGGTPGGSDYEAVGHDAWTTTDLTGDGLPDLVITATSVERDGYYHWSRIRGYESTPHWAVYENTGTGFATSPTEWAVPDGGEYLAGFDALDGTPGGSDYDAVGFDAWTTTDLTGDGLPDLVVTATAVERDGYYHWSRVRGYGENPHWAVYENTGTGFASSATPWALPEGGEYLAGFDALGGTPGGSDYEAVGYDAWATNDLTGDGLPDLVVTATAVERDGYYHWSRVQGYGSNPHWAVHKNTGAGFEAAPTPWAVPDGGEYLAGFDALSGTPGGSTYEAVGYNDWSTTDMTGDGVPDLIITATAVEREGFYHFSRVNGFGSSPRWLVFPAVP